jgi:DNA-binding transcriptional MerR regulator
VSDGPLFSIGALATRSGTNVETVRYYEKIGILPPASRTAGNHRAYTQVHADRLGFVRHSRELGFPLGSIRALLAIADDPGRSCAAVDAIAQTHLAAVRSRIVRLQALETELARMVRECGRGRVAECRVIEVLTDQSHGHCVGQDHAGTGL